MRGTKTLSPNLPPYSIIMAINHYHCPSSSSSSFIIIIIITIIII